MPVTIVNHSDDLIKYISKLNLEFSTSQTNHLLNLITGLINLEGKKNLSNLELFNQKIKSVSFLQRN